jgi:hypothetical protein
MPCSALPADLSLHVCFSSSRKFISEFCLMTAFCTRRRLPCARVSGFLSLPDLERCLFIDRYILNSNLAFQCKRFLQCLLRNVRDRVAASPKKHYTNAIFILSKYKYVTILSVNTIGTRFPPSYFASLAAPSIAATCTFSSTSTVGGCSFSAPTAGATTAAAAAA